MQVELVTPWFDQNGKRWRPGIHDMPDSYEQFLPPSAIHGDVLEEKLAVKKLPEKKGK